MISSVNFDCVGGWNANRLRRAVFSRYTGPELKAELQIWSEGITIDQRYCADAACREGATGNFSYSVPVSQYFHTDYIVLEFV